MSEILSIRKEKQNKYIIQSHSENERFTKFVVLNMLQRLGLKSRGFLEPDKFIFHAPAYDAKSAGKAWAYPFVGMYASYVLIFFRPLEDKQNF